MARRTSSRAASHDQASSPPKPDTSRRTVRSPQKRSTRATRSQSRDLDEPYAPGLRQAGRRNERQGSVDSVGSDASAASNSRGRKVRGNAPIQPGKPIDARAPGCDLTYHQTYQWWLRMKRFRNRSRMKRLGDFPTLINSQSLCLALSKSHSQRLRLRNPSSLPLKSEVTRKEPRM